MQWEIRQGTDVSMPFEEDDVVGLLERNKLGADAAVQQANVKRAAGSAR